jgi:hypothetical protein
MWIALYIAAGLVGLVILLNLVGLLLRRDHLAARKATFARPPDAVWDAIAELSAEFATKDKLPIEVEVDERPRRRVTRIIDAKLPFGGRWIYELHPGADATTVTITEAGFVKIPMLRTFTTLAPAMTITKFLLALGDRLGAPAPVGPAEPSILTNRAD